MRGTSLIEIVVYIAILSALTIAIVNNLVIVNTSLGEIRVKRALNAAASVAVERVVRLIRDAEVIQGGSVFDSSPGTLVLTVNEGSSVTYTVTRNGANALELQKSSGPTAVLTPPGVTVTNLVFRKIAPVGSKSTAIKVEITLSASSRRKTTAQNFYTTAVLRNSYAQ